ncbi:ABC transporter substrate-binding protein [Bradyrhizobium sp. Gha]|uniref:ABC transporter substrate-binding protein n=1 Tax=Bradyrhizobium sp. Gha TaxID=1855318 RepID=UPI0008E0794E|nr:ABC transporter substrate-binding protein [Bradyrhizobium sp. Gha]SFH85358.1 putative ABC transport system substrate-binding protein [Bradyrhizobium sp. Gha]
MRRRDLLAGLLATTTATAVRAAEPNRVYRLAFCNHFKRSPRGPVAIRIFDRLHQLGYIEGKNLIADGYFAEDRPERYAEIARKAVQAKPDVIVVSWDNQLIAQVAKETSTIPILWQMPSLDAGFVRNPARPEGNISGVAWDAGIEMQGKHLDILRQAVPTASRIAYLSNRYDWEGTWGHAVVQAGRNSGISIIGIPMDHWAEEEDYRRAFETIGQQSADALMFNGLGGNFTYRKLIADLALKYRLPSIGWSPDVVENGPGLLSYAADWSDYADRFADAVGQVLSGTKIADTPVSQPTKFVLAINLKTARALGLEIPAGLVARADEVIE